jgi:hypothetical protein
MIMQSGLQVRKKSLMLDHTHETLLISVVLGNWFDFHLTVASCQKSGILPLQAERTAETRNDSAKNGMLGSLKFRLCVILYFAEKLLSVYYEVGELQ